MRKTNRELCSEARARVWKENPDYIFKVDEEEKKKPKKSKQSNGEKNTEKSSSNDSNFIGQPFKDIINTNNHQSNPFIVDNNINSNQMTSQHYNNQMASANYNQNTSIQNGSNQANLFNSSIYTQSGTNNYYRHSNNAVPNTSTCLSSVVAGASSLLNSFEMDENTTPF